jgi:hypothetical protein
MKIEAIGGGAHQWNGAENDKPEPYGLGRHQVELHQEEDGDEGDWPDEIRQDGRTQRRQALWPFIVSSGELCGR